MLVVLALPELVLLSLTCGPKVWTLLNQPPLEEWDHGVSFIDSVAQPADRHVTSLPSLPACGGGGGGG